MRLTEEINRIKEVMFESLQGEDKKEYFQDEMDEIERAAQDLSRDNKFETSVKDILKVFNKAKETNDKLEEFFNQKREEWNKNLEPLFDVIKNRLTIENSSKVFDNGSSSPVVPDKLYTTAPPLLFK